MITAFPKIFAIGTDYIQDIFKEDVEITEKVDGSQWVFGKLNGTLYMRSKGVIQYPEKFDGLFDEAVKYVVSIEDRLPDNTTFYCEYVKKLKHNALKYDKIPENCLVLFGVIEGRSFVKDYNKLLCYAEDLDIDIVPLIYRGKIETADQLLKLLDTDSFLGGCKIEGVVVKNYFRPFLLGGQPIPLMAGKYVSEAFKEVHRKNWSTECTAKGKWQTFKEGYKTEARWHKAIQHYKEKGLYTGTPKDIGPLLKEISEDIIAEEKENIKNFLWKEFGQEVIRVAGSGFPQWFKTEILKQSFDENSENKENS